MSAPLTRTRVVVHGKVQGVFFRDSCRRAGATRGVAGWVRNLPDGSVEAVFEGPAEQVRAMVEWCRKGPPLARVERVDTYPEEPEGLSGFAIR